MTIHLIAAGKYQDQESWPEIWVKCFNSLAKTKNDICIWDDEGIDKLLQKEDNNFYNEYLSKLNPIYKWDYVRYIILEKYGGAYFDMDIELIEDFFDKINKTKIYLMEGTGGSYVENSIMISPLTSINIEFWKRVQKLSKNRVVKNFDKCKNNQKEVIFHIGAFLLSEFAIKGMPHSIDSRKYFDILAWEHFGNPEGTLNYTKHWQGNTWNLE